MLSLPNQVYRLICLERYGSDANAIEGRGKRSASYLLMIPPTIQYLKIVGEIFVWLVVKGAGGHHTRDSLNGFSDKFNI